MTTIQEQHDAELVAQFVSLIGQTVEAEASGNVEQAQEGKAEIFILSLYAQALAA